MARKFTFGNNMAKDFDWHEHLKVSVMNMLSNSSNTDLKPLDHKIQSAVSVEKQSHLVEINDF